MPPRIVQVPGIEPLVSSGVRHSIAPLHVYLRECILDGRLAPGTKLSQSTLSRQLGVSRTPLREVLRMLQEEGLVESEPNQRMRVAELDPAALDGDYAARILLGTLALSMTAARFGAAQKREARELLTAMRRAIRRDDADAWFVAHGTFHRLLNSAAPVPLQHQLQVLADRSVRYIRLVLHADPEHWSDSGEAEHPEIVQALVDGDTAAALSALAHHLSGTAMRVLARSAPDYTPTAVPHAVEIVAGTPLAPAAPAAPAAAAS